MKLIINSIFILLLSLGCQSNSKITTMPIEIRIQNSMSSDIENVKIFYYKGKIVIPKIKRNISYSKFIEPISDSSLSIEYKMDNQIIHKKLEVYFSKRMIGTIFIEIQSLNIINIEQNLTIR